MYLMLKTFLLFLVLVILVGGVIFLFSKLTSNGQIQKATEAVKTKAEGALPQPKEIPPETALTKSELLRILEASISAVNARIDNLPKSSTQPVAISQTTQTTTTTSSTGPKTVYIPVGFGGSGSSTSDFGSISGQEVTIDTGNYAGYKQMVFEATFRIFQGNGTGEVRLFNKTDGTAVLNSNLSTTSQDYSTKTSNSFTISTGSKTYTVQAKSSTGYSVDLQLSRIRVDF